MFYIYFFSWINYLLSELLKDDINTKNLIMQIEIIIIQWYKLY